MNRRLIFPRAWWEAIKKQTDEDYLAVTRAVFAYFFDGEEPKLKGLQTTYFEALRKHLDTQLAFYKEG